MRSRQALRHLLPAATALTPICGLAAEPAHSGTTIGIPQFAQVFGALVVVVVLIVVLGMASQRLRLGRGATGRHLRIVDALALGARERLLLVDVAGERVLIGVAGGHIARLHVLPPGGAEATDTSAELPAPGFQRVLDAVFSARKDAP